MSYLSTGPQPVKFHKPLAAETPSVVEHSNFPVPQPRLSVLNARIRAELTALGHSYSAALTHGITIGCALKELKPLVGRGNWVDHLGREFGMTVRSAQIFMLLAEHRTTLEAAQEEKRSSASLLTIRSALRLIRTGTTDTGKKKSKKDKQSSGSPLKAANWKAATLDERKVFIAAIPVVQLKAALSDDQRKEIVDRIDDMRAVKARLDAASMTVTAMKKAREVRKAA